MSAEMCCPLADNDGDPNEFEHQSFRKAAKEYPCRECGAAIARGDRHELWVICNPDGYWSRIRTCQMCAEIRSHFECGGWTFGVLWEELRENFFPNMKAGGPCMQGLSAAAKRFLVDRWLKWKGLEDG